MCSHPFWSHEVIEGPQTRWVEAELDVIPLYVRENALMPTVEPADHLNENPFELVTFDAYLFECGHFDARDTDGATRVSARIAGAVLNVAVEGAKQELGVRLIPLPGVQRVDAVRVNGVAVERLESLEIGPGAAPGWTREPDGGARVMCKRQT
jgi:alpha-D-xyloside xylohydrolase